MAGPRKEEIKGKTGAEDEGWIRRVSPKITPPSLKDNRADVDRLITAIKKALKTEEVTVDFSLVKKMPSLLRELGYSVQALLYKGIDSWHLINLLPSDRDNPVYGLAIDLGSSTVVVQLLDLVTREIKDETSFLNPQVEIGPDVLTRIHFASREEGLTKLQTLLVERLNREIDHLAKRHGTHGGAIVGVSAAGNTTMIHLFLGLDPYWICREPYIPVINKPALLKSWELGLTVHPEAPILVLPNVGRVYASYYVPNSGK